MGARIIEKHFTLDRSMKGSDQAASLEPQGFTKMVRDIRAIEKALGSFDKQLYQDEIDKLASLNLTRKPFGE
jgi:sialic acid synthase SpsE